MELLRGVSSKGQPMCESFDVRVKKYVSQQNNPRERRTEGWIADSG
jgi:hypothetical protein